MLEKQAINMVTTPTYGSGSKVAPGLVNGAPKVDMTSDLSGTGDVDFAKLPNHFKVTLATPTTTTMASGSTPPLQTPPAQSAAPPTSQKGGIISM